MLRKNGTRTDLTTAIRADVVGLAAKLANSESRVRKVPQRGSRDVGFGIVMLVSAVDWEAFSEPELVVVSVSRSDSSAEVLWEEVRDGASAAARSLNVLFTIGDDFENIEAGGDVFLGDGAVTTGVAAGLEESESLDLLLFTEDDAERESGDDVLENMFCGFCLILVR